MLTTDQIRELSEALFQRDSQSFDIEALCLKAMNTTADPAAALIIVQLLRTAAPLIFGRAYYLGVAAGLEVAQEINRSTAI